MKKQHGHTLLQALLVIGVGGYLLYGAHNLAGALLKAAAAHNEQDNAAPRYTLQGIHKGGVVDNITYFPAEKIVLKGNGTTATMDAEWVKKLHEVRDGSAYAGLKGLTVVVEEHHHHPLSLEELRKTPLTVSTVVVRAVELRTSRDKHGNGGLPYYGTTFDRWHVPGLRENFREWQKVRGKYLKCHVHMGNCRRGPAIHPNVEYAGRDFGRCTECIYANGLEGYENRSGYIATVGFDDRGGIKRFFMLVWGDHWHKNKIQIETLNGQILGTATGQGAFGGTYFYARVTHIPTPWLRRANRAAVVIRQVEQAAEFEYHAHLHHSHLFLLTKPQFLRYCRDVGTRCPQ